MSTYATPVSDYRRSAEAGDAEAQYQLGLCYKTGTGGAIEDADEALLWLGKAVDQGNQDAIDNMKRFF